MIGRGSFGAVYEIERDLFGKIEKAALKHIGIPQNPSDIDELYSDGYDDESITATFRSHLQSIVAEYSMMRKLNGAANVVNCDDVQYVQRDDGIGWDIYIKMELLTPLTKALPDQIPVETTIKLAKDMCQALVLCKRFDIVHRDIKPQNIFVSPLGDYKLGDFGIAKTVEKTMGGTKTGTYKYMAPEVYNNQPYGQQADIYSLGLVLYWMLNKKRMPFMPLPPQKLTAGIDEQTRARRLSGEQIPPPADGSEELQRIVLKACAYDPKERYHSAEEMLADLEAMGYEKYGHKASAVLPVDKAECSEPEEGTVGVFRGPATESRAKETVKEAPPAEPAEDGTVGAFDRIKQSASHTEAAPSAEPSEDGTVGAFGRGKQSVSHTEAALPAEPAEDGTVGAFRAVPKKPEGGTRSAAISEPQQKPAAVPGSTQQKPAAVSKPVQQKSVTQRQNPKKKRNLIIIIAIALTAIIGIVLAVVLSNSGGDTSTETQAATTPVRQDSEISSPDEPTEVPTSAPVKASYRTEYSGDESFWTGAAASYDDNNNVLHSDIDLDMNYVYTNYGDWRGYIYFGSSGYCSLPQSENSLYTLEIQNWDGAEDLRVSYQCIDNASDYVLGDASVTISKTEAGASVTDMQYDDSVISDFKAWTTVLDGRCFLHLDYQFLLAWYDNGVYPDAVRETITCGDHLDFAYYPASDEYSYRVFSPHETEFAFAVYEYNSSKGFVSGLVSYFTMPQTVGGNTTESTEQDSSLGYDYTEGYPLGGDVWLGHYEQDGDYSNGAEVIEWIIIAKKHNALLLLSKYCLDGAIYHTSESDITWENSVLRTWLNQSFYYDAFDEYERQFILSTELDNMDNPWAGTPGGSNTTDNVFCLSLNDYDLLSQEEAYGHPTTFAATKGIEVYNDIYCPWWLRTPGNNSSSAAFVWVDKDNGGTLMLFGGGTPVDNTGIAVRPAIWFSVAP